MSGAAVRSSRVADPSAAADGVHADLICLSHLRWDFVYQRPQHLLSRAARDRRVFFVEEPVRGARRAHMAITRKTDALWVATPHLPDDAADAEEQQAELLDELMHAHSVENFVLWYYTPMALGFTAHLRPIAAVYDCMDELSAFRGAPKELVARERELFRRADLVFTGGESLFAAKRERHANVHCVPSSIDVQHFGSARHPMQEPADQAAIPGPRLGYFGVIDERMDLELLAGIADARPTWQLVIIGPVVKIEAAELPRRANIHYLGGKSYKDLPAYIAGWDLALLPFARNDSTRFISPTKTPEYLAAGKPVISTPIHDVVHPYGEEGLVRIAATAAEFVSAAEPFLDPARDRAQWLARVDARLAQSSWDRTWAEMDACLDAVLAGSAAGSAERKSTRNA
jgi:UDP-galactopyranose mutase